MDRKIHRHLLFLLDDGSTVSLAKRDQTDVGISGPLQTGLGFFDPLMLPPLACLAVGLPWNGQGGILSGFSMFCV